MANKSNKNTMQALNGAIIISALLVVVSMFFNYITYSGTGKTGWQMFNSEYNAGKAYIVIVLILALAIAALGIMRLLGLFDGSLFTLIIAAAGAALILFSILLFATITKTTFSGITINAGKRAIGIILNLVFSIIAGLACLSTFGVRTR